MSVLTYLTETANPETVVEELTKWEEFQNHCVENIDTYVVIAIIAVGVIWALPKVIRFAKRLFK